MMNIKRNKTALPRKQLEWHWVTICMHLFSMASETDVSDSKVLQPQDLA